jgi:hypothetical protein
MCRSGNAIEMDNGNCTASREVRILWPYNPQPSIIVCLSIGSQPLNQGTWVARTARHEGKQKASPPNCHALHNTILRTCLNKDSVVSAAFIPPIGGRANPLLAHTTSPTEIAWRKEPSYSRMKNINPGSDNRAMIKRDVIR